MTINIPDLATLISYLGMAFLFGFWLVKSRTLVGGLLATGGAVLIFLLERSDRKPEPMPGILVCVLVVGAILLAGYVVTRARARRVRVYRPSRATRRAGAAAYTASMARQAAQAERAAAEIPASKPRPRAATATSPVPRTRGGYTVNARQPAGQSRSKARAASLK